MKTASVLLGLAKIVTPQGLSEMNSFVLMSILSRNKIRRWNATNGCSKGVANSKSC